MKTTNNKKEKVLNFLKKFFSIKFSRSNHSSELNENSESMTEPENEYLRFYAKASRWQNS